VEIQYNGKKITSGSFASAKFEVLVVKGDFSASERGWNAETFQESLVKAREKVGSILKDKYISKLKNGEALLDGLIFKDNSSWNNKLWRLGVRLLDSNGVRVLEAISDCIRVLDRHGKGKL
jgi:Calmodulin binding protein-like